MTIVNGTDFSEAAAEATLAAAAIARKMSVPLKLVHVVDDPGEGLAIAGEKSGVYDSLRGRARDLAIEIGTRFAIDVEPIVAPGVPWEKLNEIAEASHAGLIVVASLGDKKPHGWLLGSVAERVAQTSLIPVLVVRESASLQAWVGGERALRAMVGVEIGSTSRAALRWAAKLRATGRCDLFVTHVAWPFGEHSRLGISGPIPLDRLRPELQELLMRDLRAWAGDIPGDGETTFTASPCLGRIDTQLALLAGEANVDLLVVGTHQRAGSARLWQGSVSRGVLHQASCNVVCVPRGKSRDESTGESAGESTEDDEAMTTIRRVLIPTDFSSLANRAIPVGYGLVATGGIVHLLHVVTEKPLEDDPLRERLRALAPKGAAAKGVVTEVEVIQDETAWSGIWHAAERLGVDAICMATHGRSGISKMVLGSQAQEVMRRARQPMILVPPERED